MPVKKAHMENSITKCDWLFPHYNIPKATFLPITAQLNTPTYHKSAYSHLNPVPKSHGPPNSMNKLTLNEPAIIFLESNQLNFPIDFRNISTINVISSSSVSEYTKITSIDGNSFSLILSTGLCSPLCTNKFLVCDIDSIY